MLFVSIQDEIDYQRSYLDLEKLKRNGNFEYFISWNDPEILSNRIPSMMLQPIVENSLKHGLKNKTNGLIYINFSLDNEFIICSILDNGPGSFKEESTNSKGLQLVQQKINLIKTLTGDKIEFSCGNKLNENSEIIGFETIFKLPTTKTLL